MLSSAPKSDYRNRGSTRAIGHNDEKVVETKKRMNGASAVPVEPNVRQRGQSLGRVQNHSECCLKYADLCLDQTTLSSNIYLTYD